MLARWLSFVEKHEDNPSYQQVVVTIPKLPHLINYSHYFQCLEVRLRQVQDQLVVKMREVTDAREQSLPLKAEIEALKALLEEEEKRSVCVCVYVCMFVSD